MAGPPFLSVPSMIDNVEVEDRQRLVLVNRRTRDPLCTVAEGRNREGLQSRLAEGCRRPVSAFDLIASQFLVGRFATMQIVWADIGASSDSHVWT